MNAIENTFESARQAVLLQLAKPVKRLEFFVPSTPKGEDRGRAIVKANGRPGVRKSGKSASARQDVIAVFDREFPHWEPWDGPVLIDVIDCHYAKSSWPGKHCRKKPDWDNSGKLVGDALNGIAWTDDAIITSGTPQKTYWHRPGKWVRLTFFDPVPKPIDNSQPAPPAPPQPNDK